MVTKDSDITRLLGRLDARGLITRQRETTDRRVVISHITPKGLELIAGLDGVIADTHRRQLGHLGHDRVEALIRMLEEVRERPD
jgi:DNA-binding MarR family transcriptional regulator